MQCLLHDGLPALCGASAIETSACLQDSSNSKYELHFALRSINLSMSLSALIVMPSHYQHFYHDPFKNVLHVACRCNLQNNWIFNIVLKMTDFLLYEFKWLFIV